MSSYFISLPRTEAAKGLENLEELERKYQFIYKIAVDGESAELCGLYDGNPLPDDADYIIIPFSSSFDYNDNLWAGNRFVNVLESSGDRPTSPFSGLSWIDFYDQATQQTGITRVNNCVTDRNYYIGKVSVKAGCDSSYCSHCGNRKNLVGGHVIVYPELESAGYPSRIPGVKVGILPICVSHNKFDEGYMKVAQTTRIPIIKYTLSREDYQKELDGAKNHVTK